MQKSSRIQPLSETEVAEMYTSYKRRFGDLPSAESDVSKNQLSALAQILAAKAIPFADLSIFCPHGQRLLRRQTFLAHELNVSAGAWTRCWKRFRTGMLLLEAAEAERMEFIRNQVLPWSACFVAAIREGAFWNRELSTPATLFLSRSKREVANDDNEDTTAKPADHP